MPEVWKENPPLPDSRPKGHLWVIQAGESWSCLDLQESKLG